MNTIPKIVIGTVAVVILVASGYFLKNTLVNSEQKELDTPEKIVADYKDLLAEADELQNSAGVNCGDKKETNKKIDALEKKFADLAERKQQWLDNVPKLPEVEPIILNDNKPLGRPGSEVPELTSDVPPLPDIDPEALGSQVPELTSNVPPLPEINEIDIIDPNEPVFQMDKNAQDIKDVLQALKDLCQEAEQPPKAISDKCSDACKRHKDCAAYTEDVTTADLIDAYNACMEECPTWPKAMIKCINTTEIKTPNDCVGFVQCQVPQFYEKYTQ